MNKSFTPLQLHRNVNLCHGRKAKPPDGFDFFPKRLVFKVVTGFTLIETIVAIALIIGAAMGPFTLTARGIFGSKTIKNKLVAANLAQEGIEIIRRIRDSNEMFRCTDTGYEISNPSAPPGTRLEWRNPAIGTSYNSGCVQLPDGNWEIDAAQAAVGLSSASSPLRLLKFCVSAGYPRYGLYAYDCGGDPQAYNTIFKRRIILSAPVSSEAACVNSSCSQTANISSADIMDVRVQVEWTENGPRMMEQRERLYNLQ